MYRKTLAKREKEGINFIFIQRYQSREGNQLKSIERLIKAI